MGNHDPCTSGNVESHWRLMCFKWMHQNALERTGGFFRFVLSLMALWLVSRGPKAIGSPEPPLLIWWQNERTSSSLPNFEQWIKMSSDAVCSWVKVCFRRDMILPSVVYPPRYHGLKPTASVCVSWQENKARWNHYKTLSELCFQIVFPWLRLTCYDVGWR